MSDKLTEQRRRSRRRRLTGYECRAKEYSSNIAILDKPIECYGGFGKKACPYVDWCLEKNRERFNEASAKNAKLTEKE